MKLKEFLVRFNEIKAMGYIESHREHDTGIGKTLEDLVGIKENAIAGPDFDIYELKAKRKFTGSMMTLFTKVPQPKGSTAIVLQAFGYPERKKPHKQSSKNGNELHVTVTSGSPNSVGLWLERKGDRIIVANRKGVDVYYEQDYLREAFEKKYMHKLVYVIAENKKERGKKELFHYTDVLLLGGFSFEGFSEQIDNGVVKLEFRLGHYANGKPHDHGTGFRVFPKDLPKCFSSVERLV